MIVQVEGAKAKGLLITGHRLSCLLLEAAQRDSGPYRPLQYCGYYAPTGFKWSD